jgi:hypothetical protein
MACHAQLDSQTKIQAQAQLLQKGEYDGTQGPQIHGFDDGRSRGTERARNDLTPDPSQQWIFSRRVIAGSSRLNPIDSTWQPNECWIAAHEPS